MNRGFFRGGELGRFAPATISGTLTASVSTSTRFSGALLLNGGNGVWSNQRVVTGTPPPGLHLSAVPISHNQLALMATGWATTSPGIYSFTVAVDTGDGQTVTSAQTVTVVAPYAGFDTAFCTNYGYSTTTVANDTATQAFSFWNTGRSQTSHADGDGKHWAEVKISVAGGGTTYFIIGLVDHACTNGSFIGGGIGDDGGQQTQTTMRFEGVFSNPGTSNVASTSVNQYLMMHVDQTGTTRKIWLMSSNNGLFVGGGDPATGSNPTFTYSSNLQLHIGVSMNGAAGTTGVILNTGGTTPINPVSSGYSPWS